MYNLRKYPKLALCSMFIVLLTVAVLVYSYTNKTNPSTSTDKLVNSSSLNQEPDKGKIEKMVTMALDIQYENKKDGFEQVFTKEFEGKMDASFYKSKLKPYSVISISSAVFEERNTVDRFYVKVRVKDIQGEYIQEMHFVIMAESYLISKIENDI